jgi:membrane protein
MKALFLQRVWERPLEELSAPRRQVVAALRITHLVIRDLMEGMITLRAMGLVYTTLLALVPLLAVSFSVLKGFGVHNQMEPMLSGLLAPLGEKGDEITERIISFVDNTRAGVLGSVGLVFLVYTVTTLLKKIEEAFNYTWRVSRHRSVLRRFSDYTAILLIGPLLLFSALGVTASLSSHALVQKALEIEAVETMFGFVGRMVPYALVIIAFMAAYLIVPNTRVRARSAFVGAFIAGVLWQSTSWAFTTFIVNSASYAAIYSAFAAMVVFIVWLYANWLILLVGFTIVFYHQNPSRRTLGARVMRLSNRMREALALATMTLIARHAHAHLRPWTVDTLADALHVNGEACELVVERLLDGGFLVGTDDTPPALVLAYDLDTVMLADLLNATRASGETRELSIDHLHLPPEVAPLIQLMDTAREAALAGKTLHDLVTGPTVK